MHGVGEPLGAVVHARERAVQVNSSYFSALGDNDLAYLLARAIQFFTPGIPLVYYVGLLAGRNDTELTEETKNGRNINRHFYSVEEAEKEMERPVVQARALTPFSTCPGVSLPCCIGGGCLCDHCIARPETVT